MEYESMAFDVVIVGAGPAGLATAIQYAKLCQQNNKPVKVCLLEKASEVGAHTLSGAVIETKALDELIPDWRKLNAPITTSVTSDEFRLLSQNKARRLPTPKTMHNKGNFIVSLGEVCRWLAQYAQQLGVEIYPGFAASEIVWNKNSVAEGILTGPLGINKQGEQKPTYQPSMALMGKQIILAEGCRGSLTEKVIKQFDLRKQSQPQTYGIGFKEIWEVDPKQFQLGKVIHTIGWPLDKKTYGGSFVYHWRDNQISLGFVIGLDYQNPHLSPYDEFQRFKHHPFIKTMLEGGRCLSYGARALNEGGWQSIPQLSFPGGLLVGCGPGFMNVPKIKGSHTAMKSGILAGDALYKAIFQKPESEIKHFTQTVKNSWIGKELKKVRNIRPAFHKGLFRGLVYSALDTYLLAGHAPWTFSHHQDHTSLKLAKKSKVIQYPKPDGVLSFDKLTSVSRTNVFHEEDQPCHLKLKDDTIPLKVNWALYEGPEQKYCPAGVYEYVIEEGNRRLQINAQNCIHCKTCDIKDPKQNIKWTTPEGGGGPNYGTM